MESDAEPESSFSRLSPSSPDRPRKLAVAPISGRTAGASWAICWSTAASTLSWPPGAGEAAAGIGTGGAGEGA